MTTDDKTLAAAPWLQSRNGSEVFRLPDGSTFRYLAKGSQTGGTMGSIEFTYPPGQGFPMHIHHKEHETIYVLEGKLLIVAGAARFEVGPGEFFFGTRNVAHGFRSVGVVPVRFIVTLFPSGLEELFGAPEELQTYLKAGRTNAKYDLEIVGPAPE